ncbi:hypothetical protein KAI58_03370 [Candidatus Gracilibacteria bacterium]|nr:hypothetical protein [Candidatus Gracilibacteria bacterium]
MTKEFSSNCEFVSHYEADRNHLFDYIEHNNNDSKECTIVIQIPEGNFFIKKPSISAVYESVKEKFKDNKVVWDMINQDSKFQEWKTLSMTTELSTAEKMAKIKSNQVTKTISD